MAEEEQLEKKNKNVVEITMEELEVRPDDTPRPKPDGESKKEVLADDPKRTIVIRTNMYLEVRINMVTLLRENADILAFLVDEMPGIDPFDGSSFECR